MIEIEIKFKVEDPIKICNLLVRCGAKQYPKEREVDFSFDTYDRLLSRQAKLLRLRKTDKETLLTFKGPIIASRFKKREEINIRLDDFKRTQDLLNQIGFVGSFTKEKIRQRFSLKDTEVYLDRLPFIGYYLEIEGRDKNILNLSKRLKLDMTEAIKESYNQLFNLFCIINQEKIKKFKKKLEFSFKCEREFKRSINK